MTFSHLDKVDRANAGLSIVAPDGREGMQQHARHFTATGVPFIFDPGQGMPMFGGDERLDPTGCDDARRVTSGSGQAANLRSGSRK